MARPVILTRPPVLPAGSQGWVIELVPSCNSKLPRVAFHRNRIVELDRPRESPLWGSQGCCEYNHAACSS